MHNQYLGIAWKIVASYQIPAGSTYTVKIQRIGLNVKFYVNNADGTQTVYEGMMVKGDAAKKLSNAMSLGFNNAYFYKTIFTEKESSLLVDPVEKDRFVIKLNGQEKGQMVDKRNNKNLSTQLAEYIGSCTKLADEIKNEAFDLKVEENLINIVKEFNECK